MDSPKLDSLLDELSDLAQQTLSPADFYAALLKAVRQACRARAAGLWSVVGDKYRLEADAELLATGLDTDQNLQALHEEALATVSGLGEPSTAGSTEPPLVERLYRELELRFFPCRNRGRAFLVLEVVTDSHSSEWEFHGRLLAAVAEIVNDYYTHQRLAWLESEQAVLAELVPVLERIYAQPTLRQTAYEIVNEGRNFLGCQRVSLFQLKQRRCSILSISGVDRIHTGSRQVRALCDLVESVTLTGKELIYSQLAPTTTQYPPQQELLIQRYLDSSASRSLHIVPCFKAAKEIDRLSASNVSPPPAPQCIGAIACEDLPDDQSVYAARLTQFKQHASLALDRSMQLESMPLLSLGRRLQRFDSTTLMRWGVSFSLVLLAIAALFIIPADLTVQAKGRYQPGEVQHIYAPLGGEVIQFNHTQRTVHAGEIIVKMRSREWELKREEIMTQRGVTLEKLRGVESARLNNRRTTSTTEPNNTNELSATERELRELLVNQDQQLEIIQKMLAGLDITSPISGTILSWNPLENWELRPVQQGQKLMTIAKEDGEALLHLRVRDSDIRHVWAARNTQQSLPISFAIASEPGSRFTAQLTEIGSITETTSGDGPSVRVVAKVTNAESIHAKHGATVVARIGCGRTSLAYAWTRRVRDYVTLHWLP